MRKLNLRKFKDSFKATEQAVADPGLKLVLRPLCPLLFLLRSYMFTCTVHGVPHFTIPETFLFVAEWNHSKM